MYQPYQPYPQQQAFQPYPCGQPQQQVVPQQRPSMAGRVVSAIGDVTPNDVPMDGSAAYFPVSDGSAVYAKAWRTDGTIGTVRYVPEVQEAEDSRPQVTLADVMDRLDSMEDMLKAQKPAQRRTRKAETDD